MGELAFLVFMLPFGCSVCSGATFSENLALSLFAVLSCGVFPFLGGNCRFLGCSRGVSFSWKFHFSGSRCAVGYAGMLGGGGVSGSHGGVRLLGMFLGVRLSEDLAL